MDRRTILAIVLSMVVLQLYYMYVAPRPTTEGETDVPAVVATANPAGVPPATAVPAVAPVVAAVPVAPVVDLPVRDIPLEWCDAKGVISTDGGYLRNLTLNDYQGDLHATAWWWWVYERAIGKTSEPYAPYRKDPGPAVLLTSKSRMLGTGAGGLENSAPKFEVIAESKDSVVLRGLTNNGIQIERTIRVREDCLLTVDTTWKNVGSTAFDGKLWIEAFDEVGADAGRYGNVTRPVGMADGYRNGYFRLINSPVARYATLSSLEKPLRYDGPVSWFGLHDHYFGAFLITEPAETVEPQPASLVFSSLQLPDAQEFGEHWVVERTLQPGESFATAHKFFAGPKHLDRLAAADANLKKSVDLGWFGLLVKPMLFLLSLIHSVVGNWGLSIILLTFMLKAVLFPLTSAAFRSGQAMQALAPQMAEIRAQYADNPEEQNRQIFALYGKNGVNPMGGCLPMVAQMPVWISLYTMLSSSVELYQSKFLYLEDLSSVDPYAILPILVFLLMVVQQQITPMPATMDPAQARMMKVMPLIFGVLFFTLPSGLVVYIFVNNLLTILQQWFIKRTYKAPAPLAAT